MLGYTMTNPWHCLAWVGILATISLTEGNRYHDQFDKNVEAFLLDNGYTGGSLAAMKDGRIIYAQGYGVTNEGHEVKDTTSFPVSSISQSLTAVAILQLAEIGALDLEGKVFGHGGYLHMLKPHRSESVDPRLHDITVRNLLHHTGGWDMNKAPLFDVMLNPYYLKKGHNVPNISDIMNSPPPLSHYDTIRYMMSQRLDFTPGTKTVYSNLGYTILGRIIEEVGDTSYEDFIKQNVLKPCGMWHTRLGSKEKIAKIDNRSNRISKDSSDWQDITLYDVLHPAVIDSALGWYSNVFDMMRFLRCIENHHSSGLINKNSLDTLARRPEAAPVQHSANWYGTGFRASIEGTIWQDGDKHANDVLLFHSHKHEHAIHMPDAWVLLLDGQKLRHLKHKSHELMEYLGTGFSHDEIILHDLSDVQVPATVVKYSVDEHHLHAYVNALKQESFDVTWISGHDAHRHTQFTIIAEKTEHPHDYLVEHGLTEKKLFSRKLALEDEGFNMTYLQNYKSASHDQKHAFLAVFRKSAYDKHTHMKWGIHHYPRPYDRLLGLYIEKGYYPTVQSYIHHEDEALLSFIFLKRDNQRKVNFKEYHGLSIPQLERMVRSNANQDRKLAYVDVCMVYRKPRFSAVFTNESPKLWIFVPELNQESADKIIQEKVAEGYVPRKIVGYARTDKSVKYALYVEKKD
ncbi:uncharacterized protein [Haliotis cracherodii]|uniref:uncharacterized protein n=1 Tax=Haliotis cracherodii TaxID=6455 RepID=UPI0039E82E0E